MGAIGSSPTWVAANYGRSAGGAWRIGLADPRRPETFAATLDLRDAALCTSGGYGTRFEPTAATRQPHGQGHDFGNGSV
jgi:hypothetical protein